MTMTHALLIFGVALVVPLLLASELSTRPGHLKVWVFWSAGLGLAMLVFGAMAGQPAVSAVGIPFIGFPVIVAMAQLRSRLWDWLEATRIKREANYDASGNPRSTDDAPKPDGPDGAQR